jgi:hypothetical protein
MPAAIEVNNHVIRPGRLVGVWRKCGEAHETWGGFARSEILNWWMRKGGELVDIPADRFAERSDLDRQIRWQQIPPGQVMKGIIDPNDGKPVLRMLTRAATQEEHIRFQHPRMPVVEAPLFSAKPVSPRPESNRKPEQGELF